MALLARLSRKEAVFQVFSDLMRTNTPLPTTNNNGNRPGDFIRRQERSTGSEVLLNRVHLQAFSSAQRFPLSITQRFLSTSTNLPDSTSNELIDFKNLSATNKRLISKILGLKPAFLQELDISVTNDANQIVFNFSYLDNNQRINRHQIKFAINDTQKKRSSYASLKKTTDTISQFMFLTFDHQLQQILSESSNDTQQEPSPEALPEEIVTIFDDPFNALAFYQQTKLPTIVFKFPSSNIDQLELRQFCGNIGKHFKKIYYWSDDVDFCRNFTKSCTENFGHNQLHRVTIVEGAMQLLHSNRQEKFTSIFESASRSGCPEVLSLAEIREDLYSHLIDKQIHGVQWARFARLNEQLKGHRLGELTIITGPTGCGKTTFVSEYSLDLAEQGVRTLWGSFEIKYLSLAKIMMMQLVGRNFDACRREEFDQAWSQFARLPLFFLNFHGQTDIEDVLRGVRHQVLMHGVEHVIIDNLQFMLGLNGESNVDRFYKQDMVLGMIREFATKYKVHITLVAHPRKEKEEMAMSNNSLYGGVKASQEADNIMIIVNKWHPRFKCGKYVQITKNRAHGNLGVLPLYFDKLTHCFSSHHKAEDQAMTANRVSSSSPDWSQGNEPPPSWPTPNDLLGVGEEEDKLTQSASLYRGTEADDEDADVNENINYGNFKVFLNNQQKKTLA